MTDDLIQDKLPFSLEELEGMVLEAVVKFFDTMVGVPVQYEGAKAGAGYDELEGPPPPVLPSTKTVIVGMVGFIGLMNGVINLYMEEDLALRLTGSFLGMSDEELAEDGPEVIHDTLGEMTNMIVGTFKNSISDKGFQCRMTVPSILRGTNFTIETPSTVFRQIYSFRILNAPFIADLTMKPGE
ncbi:MAG: chemotaxis protein CheX [Opitutales bacterium]|nr:chemotaxis protein CheX [Opitutales bacterium]